MISARQIRAGRHLAGLSQADVVTATRLSLPTVKRAESDREVSVSADALSLICKALESAGIIFVEENGEGPGVRLKKQASHADLTLRIEAIKEHLKGAPHDEPPSPARGMRLLDRGHKTEVLKKLKHRRAKLGDKA